MDLGMEQEVGSYGEFPMEAMAALRQSPRFKDKKFPEPRIFVDVGSGLATLAIGMTALHPSFTATYAIEALPSVAKKAQAFVESAVKSKKLAKGQVTPLKGFVGVPLDRNIASVLEQAQVVFCYSTAWPTPDGR